MAPRRGLPPSRFLGVALRRASLPPRCVAPTADAELAPHQALGANPSGGRFHVATPCYRRSSGRKTQLVLGDKPDILKHLDRIDEGIWEQYQVHLKRTTPLERAQFYARQMEARRLKSAAALERALGEPFHRVWRALRLLELPEPVQRYLDEHRTPEMVRYFTERKLLALLKLRNPREIWRRFQDMLAESHREAGVWSQPQQEVSKEPR